MLLCPFEDDCENFKFEIYIHLDCSRRLYFMFLYYALSAVIDTLYKDFEIKKYILIKSII